MLFKDIGHRIIEPCIIQSGVPGLRRENHGRYIFRKKKVLAIGSVKKKKKFHFRVLCRYSFKCFNRKPSYAFQFVLYKKPGI